MSSRAIYACGVRYVQRTRYAVNGAIYFAVQNVKGPAVGFCMRADNIRPYDIALVCSYAFLGEMTFCLGFVKTPSVTADAVPPPSKREAMRGGGG